MQTKFRRFIDLQQFWHRNLHAVFPNILYAKRSKRTNYLRRYGLGDCDQRCGFPKFDTHFCADYIILP